MIDAGPRETPILLPALCLADAHGQYGPCELLIVSGDTVPGDDAEKLASPSSDQYKGPLMSGRTATASPSVESTTARGGNSTGSIDKVDGAWVGDAIFAGPDTLHFVFNTRQTGSSFVGTGLITGPGFGQDISFTGTATPPTMNATIQVESERANYIGTSVSSPRSAARRIGKECRSRWAPYH